MIINPSRYAAGGGGGIAVEAYASTNSNGSTSTQIFAAPSGITSGELLILIVGSFTTATTPPTGWTLLTSVAGGGTGVTVYYKVSDGTETDVTITATNFASIYYGWYFRISGADTTTPVDVIGSSWTNSSTQGQALSATTTTDGCLVFFIAGFDGADGGSFGFVSGTDWSIESEELVTTGSNSVSGCFGYKVLATAGASGNVVVSKSISDGWSNRQFAIAPA